MKSLISTAALVSLFCVSAFAQTAGTNRAIIPAALTKPAPVTAPTAAASLLPAFGTDGSAVSALVSAEDEATLSAQMAGRIKAIHYGIGQSFKAGAVLAEFDCAEQQARLQSVQAELLGARETHLTKLRLQGLGAAGELEVTLAAAAAEKARAQVRQQESQIAYCSIRAPYAGRVARARAKAFENVNVGQPVLEIVTNAKLKVAMHVPSSWVTWVRPGMPVNIRVAETGQEYSAKVARINSRVDGVSQSIELEARFDHNTNDVLPGMIGSASFPTRP